MRCLLIVALLSLATLTCAAQDQPIVEISGAYQYDHLRLSADGISGTLNFSDGADVSVGVPIRPWFDAVGDVSRVWKVYGSSGTSGCSYFGGCSVSATVSVLTYGGGFQITYRNYPHVQPFGRFILGDAHSSAGASFSGISASGSTDSFFIAPGGGLDIRIIHNLWLRVGADYLRTSKDGETVNGVRALGGFTYMFGARPSVASPRSHPQEPVSTSARMKINALGLVAAVGQEQGAEIAEVLPNGVAALAGLRPRDVINTVDGKPVKSPMELAAELSSRKTGDKVRLGYSIRGEWPSETVVILGESQ